MITQQVPAIRENDVSSLAAVAFWFLGDHQLSRAV